MQRVLLRNFALLDTRESRMRSGYEVLVEGDIIRRVSAERIDAADARIIDLGGRTLMPGVIDCHVHIHGGGLPPAPMVVPSMITAHAVNRLRDMLMRGFTTVRDAGGADYGHKQAVAQGLIPGPRMFVSGRALSQTGGHGDSRSPADMRDICDCAHVNAGIGRVADGVPGALQAAREELRLGADQIKLMGGGGGGGPSGGALADGLESVQFATDEIEAIVKVAHQAGKYVMVHAHSPLAISRCVEAGVRTIEHGCLLDEKSAELMRQRGAYLVPQALIYNLIADRGLELGYHPMSVVKGKEIQALGHRVFGIAKRAGVKIGFGTDLVRVPQYQSDEFTARLDFQSPAEIIHSATIVGAEIVRMPDKIGVVAEGAYADLLAVEGEPLNDIECMTGDGRHMAMIMKNGVPVKDRLTGDAQVPAEAS